MRLVQCLVVAVFIGCSAVSEDRPREQNKKQEEQDANQDAGFKPTTVIRRVFPAITEIPTISTEEAEGKIEDSELVLGVVVGKESRAYPINMLNGPTREILNDKLGGKAIAATW